MTLEKEPLSLFIDLYGYDCQAIEHIVSGNKYTAVLLTNGHIGVCANLGNKVSAAIPELKNAPPELSQDSHRIIYTAYLNACHNYHGFESKDDDIWDVLDFSKQQRIVMVGLFKPIVKKFEKAGIPLEIFDMIKIDNRLTEMERQRDILQQADAVILTSTSVFSNTFLDIVNATPEGCRVYMLGPSSIMVPEMLQYKNIKMIFGATFEKNDTRVLDIIENHGGTRQFLKFGGKNCLSPEMIRP
jgi:uncharacterized protein (DUF4213/DUF364 family)